MLSDFIHAYMEARKQNDKAKMDRIERDLRKIGVDRMTLMALVCIEEKNP